MNKKLVGVDEMEQKIKSAIDLPNEIKSLLRIALKSRTDDIDKIIRTLTDLGYFKKPSSIRFHTNTAKTGGLAIHSYLVCKKALRMMKEYGFDPKNKKHINSIILVTLFHDLGKVLEYKWDEKKQKWFCLPEHLVGDENSSVFLILSKLKIDLTLEEINAIKLHNIFLESTRDELNRQLAYNKTRQKEKISKFRVNLILLLQHADQVVSLHLDA